MKGNRSQLQSTNHRYNYIIEIRHSRYENILFEINAKDVNSAMLRAIKYYIKNNYNYNITSIKYISKVHARGIDKRNGGLIGSESG